MRRRDFIKGIAASAAVWPLSARAQQPAKPVIGFLHTASPGPYAHLVDAYLQGLKETGYLDGQNVTIEYRWAEGHFDRLPELADELIRDHVALIAALGGSNSTLAAKKATATRTSKHHPAVGVKRTGLGRSRCSSEPLRCALS